LVLSTKDVSGDRPPRRWALTTAARLQGPMTREVDKGVVVG
jgi:hypothetical protein